MDKPLQIHTHDSEKDGQVYNYAELADEFLPAQKRERGLVATDMDGTLFQNDLGILVFLEKLTKPQDWQMTPDTFNRLLIPQNYRSVLQQGTKNLRTGLNPENCEKTLLLRQDIISLYERLYEMKRDGEQISISHPVANEFAMKMIKLDKLFMVMDSVLMKHLKSDMLLMRTRFYNNMKKRHIPHLTKQVMARKNGHKSMLRLSTHASNQKDRITKQKLTSKELGGDEFIDRIVHEIGASRYIIMDLFNGGEGMKVRVVTTNLKEIASTAVEESSYNLLMKQYCGGHLPIVASTLERDDNGRFTAEMKTPPMFGQKKKEILLDLQRKMKHKVMCVLGDSPKNDTPMGEVSLRNGGTFIVVHGEGDYEKAREQFDPFYQQAVKENPDQNDIGQRIWYVDNQCPEE